MRDQTKNISSATVDGFVARRKGLLPRFFWGILLATVACTDTSTTDKNNFTRRDVSVVVTEEAQAALIGRTIMQKGGNAVDSAVATALALSVTMPSRVSLLGGGVCVVHDPVAKKIETIDFLPVGVGENKAATPTMMRGLFAMHTRYGQLRFEQLIGPAEKLARFDGRVSRGVINDQDDSGIKDDIYQDKQIGDPIVAEAQAGLLGAIRQKGVGSLYQGEFLQRFAAATGLPDQSIREWVPIWRSGVTTGLDAGNEQAIFGFAPQSGKTIPSLGVVTKGPGEIAVACILTAGGWFGTGDKITDLGLAPARAVPADGAGLVPPVMMVNNNVGEFHGALAVGNIGQDNDLPGLLNLLIRQRQPASGLSRQDAAGTVSAITCVRDARGTGGRNCSAAIGNQRGGLAITPQ